MGRVPSSPAPRGARAGAGVGDLAACCDLLAVAASAGCSLRQSVSAVGDADGGPVARALARVGADVDRGTPLVDAVERLPDHVGPDVRPLVSALVVAAGAGTPVAPALQRLADAERRRGRRLVEARIRRLPVLLLVPLVTFILPAFVVMTLVPVGLAAARSELSRADRAPVPAPPSPHHRRAVGALDVH